jgi:hypothetical protein
MAELLGTNIDQNINYEDRKNQNSIDSLITNDYDVFENELYKLEKLGDIIFKTHHPNNAIYKQIKLFKSPNEVSIHYMKDMNIIMFNKNKNKLTFNIPEPDDDRSNKKFISELLELSKIKDFNYIKLQKQQQTYITYKIHQDRIAAFNKRNKKSENKYTILGISISRILPILGGVAVIGVNLLLAYSIYSPGFWINICSFLTNSVHFQGFLTIFKGFGIFTETQGLQLMGMFSTMEPILKSQGETFKLATLLTEIFTPKIEDLDTAAIDALRKKPEYKDASQIIDFFIFIRQIIESRNTLSTSKATKEAYGTGGYAGWGNYLQSLYGDPATTNILNLFGLVYRTHGFISTTIEKVEKYPDADSNFIFKEIVSASLNSYLSDTIFFETSKYFSSIGLDKTTDFLKYIAGEVDKDSGIVKTIVFNGLESETIKHYFIIGVKDLLKASVVSPITAYFISIDPENKKKKEDAEKEIEDPVKKIEKEITTRADYLSNGMTNEEIDDLLEPEPKDNDPYKILPMKRIKIFFKKFNIYLKNPTLIFSALSSVSAIYNVVKYSSYVLISTAILSYSTEFMISGIFHDYKLFNWNLSDVISMLIQSVYGTDEHIRYKINAQKDKLIYDFVSDINVLFSEIIDYLKVIAQNKLKGTYLQEKIKYITDSIVYKSFSLICDFIFAIFNLVNQILIQPGLIVELQKATPNFSVDVSKFITNKEKMCTFFEFLNRNALKTINYVKNYDIGNMLSALSDFFKANKIMEKAITFINTSGYIDTVRPDKELIGATVYIPDPTDPEKDPAKKRKLPHIITGIDKSKFTLLPIDNKKTTVFSDNFLHYLSLFLNDNPGETIPTNRQLTPEQIIKFREYLLKEYSNNHGTNSYLEQVIKQILQESEEVFNYSWWNPFSNPPTVPLTVESLVGDAQIFIQGHQGELNSLPQTGKIEVTLGDLLETNPNIKVPSLRYNILTGRFDYRFIEIPFYDYFDIKALIEMAKTAEIYDSYKSLFEKKQELDAEVAKQTGDSDIGFRLDWIYSDFKLGISTFLTMINKVLDKIKTGFSYGSIFHIDYANFNNNLFIQSIYNNLFKKNVEEMLAEIKIKLESVSPNSSNKESIESIYKILLKKENNLEFTEEQMLAEIKIQLGSKSPNILDIESVYNFLKKDEPRLNLTEFIAAIKTKLGNIPNPTESLNIIMKILGDDVKICTDELGQEIFIKKIAKTANDSNEYTINIQTGLPITCKSILIDLQQKDILQLLLMPQTISMLYNYTPNSSAEETDINNLKAYIQPIIGHFRKSIIDTIESMEPNEALLQFKLLLEKIEDSDIFKQKLDRTLFMFFKPSYLREYGIDKIDPILDLNKWIHIQEQQLTATNDICQMIIVTNGGQPIPQFGLHGSNYGTGKLRNGKLFSEIETYLEADNELANLIDLDNELKILHNTLEGELEGETKACNPDTVKTYKEARKKWLNHQKSLFMKYKMAWSKQELDKLLNDINEQHTYLRNIFYEINVRIADLYTYYKNKNKVNKFTDNKTPDKTPDETPGRPEGPGAPGGPGGPGGPRAPGGPGEQQDKSALDEAAQKVHERESEKASEAEALSQEEGLKQQQEQGLDVGLDEAIKEDTLLSLLNSLLNKFSSFASFMSEKFGTKPPHHELPQPPKLGEPLVKPEDKQLTPNVNCIDIAGKWHIVQASVDNLNDAVKVKPGVDKYEAAACKGKNLMYAFITDILPNQVIPGFKRYVELVLFPFITGIVCLLYLIPPFGAICSFLWNNKGKLIAAIDCLPSCVHSIFYNYVMENPNDKDPLNAFLSSYLVYTTTVPPVNLSTNVVCDGIVLLLHLDTPQVLQEKIVINIIDKKKREFHNIYKGANPRLRNIKGYNDLGIVQKNGLGQLATIFNTLNISETEKQILENLKTLPKPHNCTDYDAKVTIKMAIYDFISGGSIDPLTYFYCRIFGTSTPSTWDIIGLMLGLKTATICIFISEIIGEIMVLPELRTFMLDILFGQKSDIQTENINMARDLIDKYMTNFDLQLANAIQAARDIENTPEQKAAAEESTKTNFKNKLIWDLVASTGKLITTVIKIIFIKGLIGNFHIALTFVLTPLSNDPAAWSEWSIRKILIPITILGVNIDEAFGPPKTQPVIISSQLVKDYESIPSSIEQEPYMENLVSETVSELKKLNEVVPPVSMKELQTEILSNINCNTPTQTIQGDYLKDINKSLDNQITIFTNKATPTEDEQAKLHDLEMYKQILQKWEERVILMFCTQLRQLLDSINLDPLAAYHAVLRAKNDKSFPYLLDTCDPKKYKQILIAGKDIYCVPKKINVSYDKNAQLQKFKNHIYKLRLKLFKVVDENAKERASKEESLEKEFIQFKSITIDPLNALIRDTIKPAILKLQNIPTDKQTNRVKINNSQESLTEYCSQIDLMLKTVKVQVDKFPSSKKINKLYFGVKNNKLMCDYLQKIIKDALAIREGDILPKHTGSNIILTAEQDVILDKMDKLIHDISQKESETDKINSEIAYLTELYLNKTNRIAITLTVPKSLTIVPKTIEEIQRELCKRKGENFTNGIDIKCEPDIEPKIQKALTDAITASSTANTELQEADRVLTNAEMKQTETNTAFTEAKTHYTKLAMAKLAQLKKEYPVVQSTTIRSANKEEEVQEIYDLIAYLDEIKKLLANPHWFSKVKANLKFLVGDQSNVVNMETQKEIINSLLKEYNNYVQELKTKHKKKTDANTAAKIATAEKKKKESAKNTADANLKLAKSNKQKAIDSSPDYGLKKMKKELKSLKGELTTSYNSSEYAEIRLRVHDIKLASKDVTFGSLVEKYENRLFFIEENKNLVMIEKKSCESLNEQQVDELIIRSSAYGYLDKLNVVQYPIDILINLMRRSVIAKENVMDTLVRHEFFKTNESMIEQLIGNDFGEALLNCLTYKIKDDFSPAGWIHTERIKFMKLLLDNPKTDDSADSFYEIFIVLSGVFNFNNFDSEKVYILYKLFTAKEPIEITKLPDKFVKQFFTNSLGNDEAYKTKFMEMINYPRFKQLILKNIVERLNTVQDYPVALKIPNKIVQSGEPRSLFIKVGGVQYDISTPQGKIDFIKASNPSNKYSSTDKVDFASIVDSGAGAFLLIEDHKLKLSGMLKPKTAGEIVEDFFKGANYIIDPRFTPRSDKEYIPPILYIKNDSCDTAPKTCSEYTVQCILKYIQCKGQTRNATLDFILNLYEQYPDTTTGNTVFILKADLKYYEGMKKDSGEKFNKKNFLKKLADNLAIYFNSTSSGGKSVFSSDITIISDNNFLDLQKVIENTEIGLGNRLGLSITDRKSFGMSWDNTENNLYTVIDNEPFLENPQNLIIQPTDNGNTHYLRIKRIKKKIYSKDDETNGTQTRSILIKYLEEKKANALKIQEILNKKNIKTYIGLRSDLGDNLKYIRDILENIRNLIDKEDGVQLNDQEVETIISNTNICKYIKGGTLSKQQLEEYAKNLGVKNMVNTQQQRLCYNILNDLVRPMSEKYLSILNSFLMEKPEKPEKPKPVTKLSTSELSETIVNDVKSLSGPMSGRLLVPKASFERELGHKPPVVLLLGDVHNLDGTCPIGNGETDGTKMLSLYADDPTFYNYLAKLAEEHNVDIDLFIESWIDLNDIATNNKAGWSSTHKSALVESLTLFDSCIGNRNDNPHHTCLYKQFRTHLADTRQMSLTDKKPADNISTVLFDELFDLKNDSSFNINLQTKMCNIRDKLKKAFPDYKMSQVISELEKLCETDVRSSLNHFFTSKFFEKYSRTRHQFSQLNSAVQTKLRNKMNTNYSNIKCDSKFKALLSKITNYSIHLGEEKQCKEAPLTIIKFTDFDNFQDNYKNFQSFGFGLILIDTYTVSRALKKTKDGKTSELSVIYEGNTHTTAQLNLLSEFYDIKQEWGSDTDYGQCIKQTKIWEPYSFKVVNLKVEKKDLVFEKKEIDKYKQDMTNLYKAILFIEIQSISDTEKQRLIIEQIESSVTKNNLCNYIPGIGQSSVREIAKSLGYQIPESYPDSYFCYALLITSIKKENLPRLEQVQEEVEAERKLAEAKIKTVMENIELVDTTKLNTKSSRLETKLNGHPSIKDRKDITTYIDLRKRIPIEKRDTIISELKSIFAEMTRIKDSKTIREIVKNTQMDTILKSKDFCQYLVNKDGVNYSKQELTVYAKNLRISNEEPLCYMILAKLMTPLEDILLRDESVLLDIDMLYEGLHQGLLSQFDQNVENTENILTSFLKRYQRQDLLKRQDIRTYIDLRKKITKESVFNIFQVLFNLATPIKAIQDTSMTLEKKLFEIEKLIKPKNLCNYIENGTLTEEQLREYAKNLGLSVKADTNKNLICYMILAELVSPIFYKYKDDLKLMEKVPYPKEPTDLSSQQLVDTILQDMHSLCGPVGARMLIPKDDIELPAGFKLPTILQLDDMHVGTDPCIIKGPDGKPLSLYMQDQSFYKYLEKLAKEHNVHIDFFLEQWRPLSEHVEQTFIIGNVHDAVPSVMMSDTLPLLTPCATNRNGVEDLLCPYPSFHTHFGDPRRITNTDAKYNTDNIMGIILNTLNTVDCTKPKEVMKKLYKKSTELYGIEGSIIFPEIKKLCNSDFNKVIDDFFTSEFQETHSRTRHEFDKLPEQIKTKLREKMKTVYKVKDGQCKKEFSDILDKIVQQKDLTCDDIKYLKNEHSHQYYHQFGTFMVDVYTVSRALKGSNSDLAVIFQGVNHNTFQNQLLEDLYTIRQEWGSSQEVTVNERKYMWNPLQFKKKPNTVLKLKDDSKKTSAIKEILKVYLEIREIKLDPSITEKETIEKIQDVLLKANLCTKFNIDNPTMAAKELGYYIPDFLPNFYTDSYICYALLASLVEKEVKPIIDNIEEINNDTKPNKDRRLLQAYATGNLCKYTDDDETKIRAKARKLYTGPVSLLTGDINKICYMFFKEMLEPLNHNQSYKYIKQNDKWNPFRFKSIINNNWIVTKKKSDLGTKTVFIQKVTQLYIEIEQIKSNKRLTWQEKETKIQDVITSSLLCASLSNYNELQLRAEIKKYGYSDIPDKYPKGYLCYAILANSVEEVIKPILDNIHKQIEVIKADAAPQKEERILQVYITAHLCKYIVDGKTIRNQPTLIEKTKSLGILSIQPEAVCYEIFTKMLEPIISMANNK